MRVLVTNDDGIDAPGLHVLARSMQDAGHDVQVLAPSREFSGSSAGLGVVAEGAHIAVREVPVPGLSGVPSRTVDAPPALAVRAMCVGAFGWQPELVVSGVNPGFNTGRLVIHSGTVGAALTASSFGVRSLAVSTASDSPAGNDSAASLATWLVEPMAGSDPVTVSLNVPGEPIERLAGVRVGTLSSIGFVDLAWRVSPDALEVQRVTHAPPFPDGTDAELLALGYASLTAIAGPWADRVEVTDLAQALDGRLPGR